MSAAETLMAEFHAKADAALPALLREAAAAALDRALSGAGPLLRIDDAGRLFFGKECDWKQARREFVKLNVPFYRLSSRDHRVNVAEVRKAIEARRVDGVRGGRNGGGYAPEPPCGAQCASVPCSEEAEAERKL